MISVVGNVIGRGAHFKVEQDKHYCKINPVLVGETSKARKGTGLNRIKQFVELVDEEWFESCIAFGKEEREIGLSAEVEDQYGHSARELWEEVYADLSEGKRGLFGPVVSRGEAYVRRIATVYAVLDLSEEVKIAHLLAALGVWQYCEQSAYLIFGDRTGDRLADELLEPLKDAGEEGMTRNEIYDHFGRNQRSARLGGVLRDLERQGLARMEKEKTDGRHAERWFARDA